MTAPEPPPSARSYQPVPEYLQHDALCQRRRSQGVMACDCPHGRAAEQPGFPVRSSVGQARAHVLDRERKAAEKAAAARPKMIAFDLSSGATSRVPRCCDAPRPVAGDPARSNSGARPWHCDLKCASCGATLAVLRWRL